MLTLQDAYPRQHTLAAMVDVKLLLPTLKSSQTDVGQWVNIIGYITARPDLEPTPPANSSESRVYLQALLLWSAGPIDLGKYEACVKDR